MLIKNKIKILREITLAGILDCKNAIIISNSNFNKAIKILRQKELNKAYKVIHNYTKKSIISNYINHNYNCGVMLELSCQTDFVTRNEKFKELGNNLAKQIGSLKNIKYISSLNIPKDAFLIEFKNLNKSKLIFYSKNNLYNIFLKLTYIIKILSSSILARQSSFYYEGFNVENSIYNHMAIFGENIKLDKFVRYLSK